MAACRLKFVLVYVRDVHEPNKGSESAYESRLPKPLARMKSWLVAHHMTLMTIADTPHSIAFGSAIGIFFGFTPLYPLKTLLSIAVAWIFRCNKIAAAIAVTLHDVLIWVMPAIYVAEYQFGCWILNRPVAQRVHFRQFRLHDYVHWHVFSRVIWPTFWPAFIGSLFLSIPSAISCLFSHAPADQPRQGNAENSMKVECVVLNKVSMESAASGRSVEAARGRAGSSAAGLECVLFNR